MGRILMVDDEQDLPLLIRQKFRHQIQSGTLSFFFAHDGFEALKTLEETPNIEVVITDIHMPGMDGLTLLEKISTFFPQVRCVVLSAYDDWLNLRKAMNHGAFDFISKPMNMEELERVILKSLKKKKRPNVAYFSPSIFQISQDDKDIFSFLKGFSTTFEGKNKPKKETVCFKHLTYFPYTVELLFDPEKNPVILDLFPVNQGAILLIMVITHAMVPFTSILKIREIFKGFSLVALEPQLFFKYIYEYQRTFTLSGVSLARCFFKTKSNHCDFLCIEDEGYFKQSIHGKSPFEDLKSGLEISDQTPLYISFESKDKTTTFPLLSIQKKIFDDLGG